MDQILRDPDPGHKHAERSLTDLDAWLWGDLSLAPPDTFPSALPKSNPQAEAVSEPQPAALPAPFLESLDDSPEAPDHQNVSLIPVSLLDEPQSMTARDAGQEMQVGEYREIESTWNPPQTSPWSTYDEDSAIFVSEDPIAYNLDIDEIDEDFVYSLEIDSALEARLELIRQQDYSRRVEMLTDQLCDKYDYGGGLTYNDLIAALRVLDRNLPALMQLRDELTYANVTVKRKSYQAKLKRVSAADHQLLKSVFGALIENNITPDEALLRLGYEGVDLTDTQRAMLVDALERHTLYREEERALLEKLTALTADDSKTQPTKPGPRGSEPSNVDSLHLNNTDLLPRFNLGESIESKRSRESIDRAITDELDAVFDLLVLDEADLLPPDRAGLVRKSVGRFNSTQLITLDSPEGRPLVNLLIEDNLWLVARIARHYMGRGLPLEDLFQEGVLGLYRALPRFDVSSPNRFMTYASAWVHQTIGRAVADKARIIRLPVHALEMFSRLERGAEDLQQMLGRDPTAAELGDELNARFGITPENVRKLLEAPRTPVSLDINWGAEVEGEADSSTSSSTLEQAVLEQAVNSADPDLSDQLLKYDLDKVLLALPKRDRNLLATRYGLNDDCPHTLEETAKTFGVTRERIRQIETRILAKLRYAIHGASNLKEYLRGDIPVSEKRSIKEVEEDQYKAARLEANSRFQRSAKLVRVFATMGYPAWLAEVESPSYLAELRAEQHRIYQEQAQLARERENKRREQPQLARERENERREQLENLRQSATEMIVLLQELIAAEEQAIADYQIGNEYFNELININKKLAQAQQAVSEIQDLEKLASLHLVIQILLANLSKLQKQIRVSESMKKSRWRRIKIPRQAKTHRTGDTSPMLHRIRMGQLGEARIKVSGADS